MIMHEIDTGFGGKVTKIEVRHYSCLITTAKEGFLKGLSTMVFMENNVACAKWVYRDHVSKKNRQMLHSLSSSTINDHLESGYCLRCAIQEVELKCNEYNVVSDFDNFLKCEGGECSKRGEKERQRQEQSRQKSENSRKNSGEKSRSYEEVLGLSSGWTKSELKDAYKRKCHQTHPDKWREFPEDIVRRLEKEFKEVQNAYKNLLKK